MLSSPGAVQSKSIDEVVGDDAVKSEVVAGGVVSVGAVYVITVLN